MNDAGTSQPAVCRLSGISKSFGDVKALSDVSFDVRKGEFLAIVGENGAGKSTAMSILFGLLEPDTGHIEIDGKPRKLKSARDAIDAGFGMVHQHFKLYPDLTVLENVLVGDEGANGLGLIPFRDRRKAFKKLVSEFSFSLDPDRKVSDLPVDARQQLEIVKMLSRGASTVILDEPTAVLTPQESLALYTMLKKLCAQGKSVVLITHKLGEVMDNSERVLVMRQGELVAERQTADTNPDELAELMVGRQIEAVEKVSGVRAEVVASLQDVSVAGLSDKPALDAVSFDLRAGEIFGVAGVSGNGQKELVNAIVGLETISGGTISFQDRTISAMSVAQRRAAGIGYMAEDRMAMGLAARGSVAENLISGREGRPEFSASGFLRARRIRQFARELVKSFDIRTPSAQQQVGNLSGGNQQKVIVARELSAKPRFLVVENPCWGIDVGAISFIHQQILDLAADGVAVLLISNDLEELFALSDRVGVMFEGRMNRIFDRSELDAFAVGAAMSGTMGEAA
ncbi:ABC transporter ATP-binding protein [Hoeflea prorocentri]|uniref:ABC transporter ATP-binding protein n=1 Tax=Hoeflea prorocentri TaxID=1922333 RepID=A0A9X3UM39_9HYPH|nr:ABC transporter ATP-binding protein [Hoeflea prorocentri]MCY6381591.1 ABC transporter ATP-binding protein [Hoeflea prorocentri]MDA5399391.1 ABC transporter ATP-binding protein [Hoeflea prorocentri]